MQANVGNVSHSAGARRLDKILAQPSTMRIGYVPDEDTGGRQAAAVHLRAMQQPTGPGPAVGAPARGSYVRRRSLAVELGKSTRQLMTSGGAKGGAHGGLRVADPNDQMAVGDLVARIAGKLRVDPRSIGGDKMTGNGKKKPSAKDDGAGTNILLGAGKDGDGKSAAAKRAALRRAEREKAAKGPAVDPIAALTNECLLSLRVGKFEVAGGSVAAQAAAAHAAGKKGKGPTKARNKLRYVCIVRTTNRPLLRQRGAGGGDDDDSEDEDEDEADDDGVPDDDSAGYDKMFSPEGEAAGGGKNGRNTPNRSKQRKTPKIKTKPGKDGKLKVMASDDDIPVPPEDEISSFPALVCLALHSDGTNPDIRRVIELDKLVGVEAILPRVSKQEKEGGGGGGGSKGVVVLTFRGGDRVEIDCDVGGRNTAAAAAMAADGAPDGRTAANVRRERLLWSLLQIHAILCTSVVERNASTSSAAGRTGSSSAAAAAANSLPPLTIRNVDRAELQYVSQVNNFLTASPALMALLERQRSRSAGGVGVKGKKKDGKDDRDGDKSKGEGKDGDEMDVVAYDMMMGNYDRQALFVSEEEKKDAEEILNDMPWQRGTRGVSADDARRMSQIEEDFPAPMSLNVDAAATADHLASLLQQRMRDLEAETCRRLIAWEDEKHYSATGQSPAGMQRDTVDALSLAALFNTLDILDTELEEMEGWLRVKAEKIKPLTDDCRDIEEENRQLEQQWKSYDELGQELRRLLSGLDVPTQLQRILANPGSVLRYDPADGSIQIGASEAGVEDIYQAGRALRDAIDVVEKEGGVHLRAVSERVEDLASVANSFCTALAQIVVTVMEQLAGDIVASTDFTKSAKGENHTVIAKKIRDAQRKFQSSLLSYIKLIEVLALLKPSILPAIRDAYSELVSEGILSKKRMKVYFASLPGRNSASWSNVTSDLKEYSAVTLRSSGISEAGTANMKPVNSQDIQKALSEMLPVIAREAYFTAALFGLSSRHMDGREKKRNFESAKKSVDHSSQYFRYYMSRVCGIASEPDAEGKKVIGDPMLSLVASIHLNEAMDGYIDRQKKGGDHSLSLAYVRATILDLRKKVDKQWVTWVEEQIKWIRTSPGVPPNGKRAGVFTTCARVPSYLDHVMICCKAGRPSDYTPNLHNIKVITYYLQKMASALFTSLHECAERETTDQQYAANVMRMENSYFFTQSIKQRGSEMTNLFQKQIAAASAICKQSTDAYLGWMIKREFKALHSLFSNISRIRRDVGDADVPIHVPRATFVKTLTKESNREVLKEKIGIIYARMEKHLSEAGGLLPVAWKALVKVLYEWFGRWEKLSTQCYKYILEPSAVDVVRIAKAAGGGTTVKAKLSSEKATLIGAGNHGARKPMAAHKRVDGDF